MKILVFYDKGNRVKIPDSPATVFGSVFAAISRIPANIFVRWIYATASQSMECTVLINSLYTKTLAVPKVFLVFRVFAGRKAFNPP